MTGEEHNPKGGNRGGSRAQRSSHDSVQPSNPFPEDEPERVKEVSSERGGEERSDDVSANDPHKVEKLAKAGRHDFDTDAGAD